MSVREILNKIEKLDHSEELDSLISQLDALEAELITAIKTKKEEPELSIEQRIYELNHGEF